MISKTVTYLIRIFTLVLGLIRFGIERPKVDYSKWLGPDWKSRYDRYGISVSNHLVYIDIFLLYLNASTYNSSPPAFLCKEGVRKIPFLGYMCEVIGCVFTKRGGTSQARAFTLDLIT